MKIQCNVCESAEATVLCCADEAALCWTCDEKVHDANKLASKHQRVPLLNSNSQMPKCDICQETVGYFFCLEDRALLCRICDVAIHTVNVHVSSHQRFLLTGVKVGLEAADLVASKAPEAAAESLSLPSSVPISTNSRYDKIPTGDFGPLKLSFAGGSLVEGIQQWQFDDFLGLTDLNQNYNYIDNGSSKADSGKMVDSDCSPILRSLAIELDGEDCLGRVPDSSWSVPQIPSPPTASELSWPKALHHHPHHHHDQHDDHVDAAAFVPDVCYSSMLNFHHNSQKRSRHW